MIVKHVYGNVAPRKRTNVRDSAVLQLLLGVSFLDATNVLLNDDV